MKMVITKEICDRLLLANSKNRRVSQNRVEAIARAMRSGKFVADNGQTIVVTKSWNRLIDGQHRLLAMRFAGIYGFEIIIVEISDDRADEVFNTIDTVRSSRSNAQVLSLTTDIPNVRNISSIVATLLRIDLGSFSPSPSEIVEFYNNHKSTIVKMKTYTVLSIGKIAPHAAFWAAVLNAIFISGKEDEIIERVHNILSNKCGNECDNLILNIIISYKGKLKSQNTAYEEFYKVTKGLLHPELKVLKMMDNEDLSPLRASSIHFR